MANTSANIGINLRATASGKDAVESIGNAFAGVEKRVQSAATAITKEMRQAEAIVRQAGSGVAAHWTKHLGGVVNILGTISNTALTVFKTVTTVGVAAFNAILGSARFVFGVVGGLIHGLLGVVRTLASGLLGIAGTLAKIGAAGVLGGGVLGISGGVGALSVYAEFEQSIRNAMTTTGLFGRELVLAEAAMSRLAREIGAFSTYSAAEVGKAFYSLASAGLDVNQIIAASPGVIALAEGTLEDIGSTAELVTSQLMAFRLEASETARVVNVLAAAAAASPLTMYRLAESLKYLSPVARNFGLQVEDAVALLGVLSKVGIHGSEAGTALRQALLRTVTQRGPGQDVLRQAGLTSQTFSPQVVGVEGMIRGLQRVMATTGMGGLSRLVGLEGVSAALALATAGAAEFRKMREQVTGTNMAFQMQALQLETVHGRWEQLTSMVEEARHSFGEAARGGIMAFLQSLQDVLQAFTEAGVFQTAGQVFGYIAQAIGEAARQLQPYATVVRQVLVQMGNSLVMLVQYGMARLPYVLNWIVKVVQGAPSLIASVLDRAVVVMDWLLNALPGLVSAAFALAGRFLVWFGNALMQVGAYLQGEFQQDVVKVMTVVYAIGSTFVDAAAVAQKACQAIGWAVYAISYQVQLVVEGLTRWIALEMRLKAVGDYKRWEKSGHKDQAALSRSLQAMQVSDRMFGLANDMAQARRETPELLRRVGDTSWVGGAKQALWGASTSTARWLQNAGATTGGWLQQAAPWAYAGAQWMNMAAGAFAPSQVPAVAASQDSGFVPWGYVAPGQPWMSGTEPTPQPQFYGIGARGPRVFTSRGWTAPAYAQASGYGGTTLVFNISGADKQTIMTHISGALDRWQQQSRRDVRR